MKIDNTNKLNRRLFLRSSALFAVAISVPGFFSCKDDDTISDQNNCITTADILGPFYKAGAPFGENIIPTGSTGTPLIVKGKVFSNCEEELRDAIVEVWNADEEGKYDTSEKYLFRGRYKTEQEGIYRFKTIIPGRYLNGSTFRPSHLHFRITAPGHRELVSQIYFKDDPYISSDRWASDSAASKRILLIEKDTNGIDMVNFDIHLSK